jgi:hypothetical protein
MPVPSVNRLARSSPHPLEPLVRAAFGDCPTQDRLTLIRYLVGPDFVDPANDSKVKAAREVIDSMLGHGALTIVHQKFYRLTTPVAARGWQ